MARETIAAKSSTANPRNAVRTKSRRDIREQLFRIVEGYNYEDNNPRIDRAYDIASRYEENIMGTRKYNRDVRNIMTSIGGARTANMEKMWKRRYKRSEYMK